MNELDKSQKHNVKKEGWNEAEKKLLNIWNMW